MNTPACIEDDEMEVDRSKPTLKDSVIGYSAYVVGGIIVTIVAVGGYFGTRWLVHHL